MSKVEDNCIHGVGSTCTKCFTQPVIAPSSLPAGEAAKASVTYTRAEVQKWRDDVAHAAADMVKHALKDDGYDWLVQAISRLASTAPAESNQEVVYIHKDIFYHLKKQEKFWTYLTASPENKNSIALCRCAPKAKTKLGARLLELREKAISEGMTLMTNEEIIEYVRGEQA